MALLREGGRLVDCAVVVATGITTDGQRAHWAEENLPEGFAAFGLPHGQQVWLRTTNGLERINSEIKRRTRVASVVPNTASCRRLVSALLAERDEDSITGKIYLNLKD